MFQICKPRGNTLLTIPDWNVLIRQYTVIIKYYKGKVSYFLCLSPCYKFLRPISKNDELRIKVGNRELKKLIILNTLEVC